MKFFVVFAMCVAASLAAPQITADSQAQIVRQELDNIGTGTYRHLVQTSNGISQQEEGQIVDQGTENEGLEVQGQFEYTGVDGVKYIVTYTAGRNGFRPSGAHLPA